MSYERDLVDLRSRLKFPVTEHDTANDATDSGDEMKRTVMMTELMIIAWILVDCKCYNFICFQNIFPA